ncbi:putative Homeobox-like domain superfamily, myb-like transcription factor [Plasmopara halstedii]
MEAPGIKRERESKESMLQSLYDTPSKAQKSLEEGKGKRWTPDQDDALRKAVEEFGQRNWKAIASRVGGRNHAQCLQRWNKVLKPGLVKGHWSFEEDSTLEQMVLQGCHSWGEVAAHIPGRTAKQCRERWRNHLDPSINKSPFSLEEDTVIQRGFEHMGNRWTQIAELLPGRTEDAVKLRWKALNPNQRVKAKPGRPKLMPGFTVNKSRSTIPPTPDDVAASMMNGSIMIPDLSTYEYENSTHTPCCDNGASTTSKSMHSSQIGMPNINESLSSSQDMLPDQFYEPIVEPQSDDVIAELDMRDVVMLKELLHSHTNSLLSFGSACGLSSMTEMSPEDLLESGELDEMFRATVSISKEKEIGNKGRCTQSLMDNLTSSFKNPASLQKAVQMLDQDDKHLFHELVDSWRMRRTDDENAILHDVNLPVEVNAYSQHNFVKKTSQKSALMADSDESRSISRRNSNGILHELGNISNDIGDLLHSDLMRPIRKGRLYL